MNVKQCPNCKRYDTQYSILTPEFHHEKTEIWLLAYCPDCGYSWTIVYIPDRTEDR
jgi:C4-type Zn-finger protein